MISKFLIIFFIVSIIIFLISEIITKSAKEDTTHIDDIMNQLDIYTSDILDILDNILSNTDNIPDVETRDDFLEYVLTTSSNECKSFIKLNIKDDGLPENFIDYISNDLIKEKIIKIIEEYKYDSNINTMYDRYKFLKGENTSEEKVDSFNSKNEIIESVNNFYNDVEGEEL